MAKKNEKSNSTNAVHITLHDLSGAPINPKAASDFEKAAEELAKREGLVVNVARS